MPGPWILSSSGKDNFQQLASWCIPVGIPLNPATAVLLTSSTNQIRFSSTAYSRTQTSDGGTSAICRRSNISPDVYEPHPALSVFRMASLASGLANADFFLTSKTYLVWSFILQVFWRCRQSFSLLSAAFTISHKIFLWSLYTISLLYRFMMHCNINSKAIC